MIRPILRHGAAMLHRAASPVTEISRDVLQLIEDMIETMHAAPGVGLAAPQVGTGLRVFVIDLSIGARASELIVMINPSIEERDGLQLEEEGCLSLPGVVATVGRPRRTVVKGLDRDGREHRVEGTDLLARAIQHEMDHLDGRLYLDRLRGLRRALMLRRIARLKQQGPW